MSKRDGVVRHFGRVHELCFEKNAELPENDPKRKFKGRVVFLGNQVVDHNWERAMFQELASCPATMAASKMADAYGCLPGHDQEIADATQAYTQAELKGTETWVELPEHQWPEAWRKRTDLFRPVCPLVLAWYGHPDSGGHWERHCEAHLFTAGFERAEGPWPSTYWRPGLRLFLVVYVDDFKVVGPTKQLKKG